MEIFTVKFWIAFQMAVDLALVFLIVYFLRFSRAGISRNASNEAVERIVGMLKPLLKEADETAKAFEKQLKEKHQIIHHLNERLDARIISLNMLLNRAEGKQGSGATLEAKLQSDVYDQQKAIIDLFNKGYNAETAASKLALPRREVELVFNLKQKFLKIEQDMPFAGK